MWNRSIFALFLAILLAVLIDIGCGGPDFVVGSSQPLVPTSSAGTPTVTCGQAGDACSFGTDCCSGSCDPILFECQ